MNEVRLMDRIASHGGFKLSAGDLEKYNRQGARGVRDNPPPPAPSKSVASRRNVEKNRRNRNGFNQGWTNNEKSKRKKKSGHLCTRKTGNK